jgi:CheY-like chemotaxis protein
MSRSILIVDSCPQTRRVLTPLLTEQGYEITIVSNAAAALERLWERTFGLVLVDTTEDPVSGEGLLETLRSSDPASAQLRAAFVELGDESKKTRLLAAGCAACLDKPIHFHDLTMSLSQLFSAANAA